MSIIIVITKDFLEAISSFRKMFLFVFAFVALSETKNYIIRNRMIIKKRERERERGAKKYK